MPTQLMLSNNLGGIGNSYASIQDLDNLLLPRDHKAAVIKSRVLVQPSGYALLGKTLKYQVTVDSEISSVLVFTFPANYTSINQVAAAIQMDDIVASVEAGKIVLSTIKKGYSQGIYLWPDGTANPLLNFNDLEGTNKRGSGSITNEFSDDEKAYALVAASSLANSYLKRRYTLPLTDYDMSLIENVCCIAAYTLVFREGYSPESGSYDANWKSRKEEAIEWLSEVGNRKIHPYIKGGIKPVPKANNGSISTDPRGWRIAAGLCDTESY